MHGHMPIYGYITGLVQGAGVGVRGTVTVRVASTVRVRVIRVR